MHYIYTYIQTYISKFKFISIGDNAWLEQQNIRILGYSDNRGSYYTIVQKWIH